MRLRNPLKNQEQNFIAKPKTIHPPIIVITPGVNLPIIDSPIPTQILEMKKISKSTQLLVREKMTNCSCGYLL